MAPNYQSSGTNKRRRRPVLPGANCIILCSKRLRGPPALVKAELGPSKVLLPARDTRKLTKSTCCGTIPVRTFGSIRRRSMCSSTVSWRPASRRACCRWRNALRPAKKATEDRVWVPLLALYLRALIKPPMDALKAGRVFRRPSEAISTVSRLKSNIGPARLHL
jgi:hypothetical protein